MMLEGEGGGRERETESRVVLTRHVETEWHAVV